MGISFLCFEDEKTRNCADVLLSSDKSLYKQHVFPFYLICVVVKKRLYFFAAEMKMTNRTVDCFLMRVEKLHLTTIAQSNIAPNDKHDFSSQLQRKQTGLNSRSMSMSIFSYCV